MKIFYFGLLALIFLSGCSSINTVDKNVYDTLKSEHEFLYEKLQNYIQNDEKLSPRDKNTLKTREQNYQDAFKSLKRNE